MKIKCPKIRMFSSCEAESSLGGPSGCCSLWVSLWLLLQPRPQSVSLGGGAQAGDGENLERGTGSPHIPAL